MKLIFPIIGLLCCGFVAIVDLITLIKTGETNYGRLILMSAFVVTNIVILYLIANPTE